MVSPRPPMPIRTWRIGITNSACGIHFAGSLGIWCNEATSDADALGSVLFAERFLGLDLGAGDAGEELEESPCSNSFPAAVILSFKNAPTTSARGLNPHSVSTLFVNSASSCGSGSFSKSRQTFGICSIVRKIKSALVCALPETNRFPAQVRHQKFCVPGKVLNVIQCQSTKTPLLPSTGTHSRIKLPQSAIR